MRLRRRRLGRSCFGCLGRSSGFCPSRWFCSCGFCSRWRRSLRRRGGACCCSCRGSGRLILCNRYIPSLRDVVYGSGDVISLLLRLETIESIGGRHGSMVGFLLDILCDRHHLLDGSRSSRFVVDELRDEPPASSRPTGELCSGLCEQCQLFIRPWRPLGLQLVGLWRLFLLRLSLGSRGFFLRCQLVRITE